MYNLTYPDTSNSSGTSSCHGTPTILLAAACFIAINALLAFKSINLKSKISPLIKSSLEGILL